MTELLENEKKLQAEIDSLKMEKEFRVMDVSKEFEKEKEIWKSRVENCEERIREADKKRSALLFEMEKERAKWQFERDHIT